jgi:hypothetical protein
MRGLSGASNGEDEEADSVPGGGSRMNNRCGLERVGSVADTREPLPFVVGSMASTLVVACTAEIAEMSVRGDADVPRSCAGEVGTRGSQVRTLPCSSQCR